MKKTHSRRTIIKVATISGAAITSKIVLPDKWLKPVAEFFVSPVHAQTSAPPPITGPDKPTGPPPPSRPSPSPPPDLVSAYNGDILVEAATEKATVNICAQYAFPSTSTIRVVASAENGACVYTGSGSPDGTTELSLQVGGCSETALIDFFDTGDPTVVDVYFRAGNYTGEGTINQRTGLVCIET